MRELSVCSTRTDRSLVRFGKDCRREICSLPGEMFFVIDENAERCHPAFAAEIRSRGTVFSVPSGERYKTLETFCALVNRLAEAGLTRSDALVGIGGGVVTDLAGFAASSYLRGIRYLSVPTTLLGMVDAAIGGKCGVDLPAGKNLVGAFYQPEAVYADPAFLDTLPEEEVKNGIGEILKYAVIADAGIFGLCEDFDRNREEIVLRCMEIKCRIVSEDERESGRRMLLNFGHTIGHAIETVGNFDTYSHGRAVATGMVYESRFLAARGLVSEADCRTIERRVRAFGLWIDRKFVPEEIERAMLHDKKRRGDVLKFSGFSEIGKGVVYSFPLDSVRRTLEEIL